jgi:hypothetical protein
MHQVGVALYQFLFQMFSPSGTVTSVASFDAAVDVRARTKKYDSAWYMIICLMCQVILGERAFHCPNLNGSMISVVRLGCTVNMRGWRGE